MRISKKSQTLLLPAFCFTAVVLSGCLFGGDSTPGTDPNVSSFKVEACKDLPPAQQKTADSLVALATDKMKSEMKGLFDSSNGSWENAKARNTDEALKLYDQALVVAPGHCGATFGRSIASALTLNHDAKLDQMVKKMDSANQKNSSSNSVIGSTTALLKMTPDKAMPILLKTSAKLQTFDYPTVTEFQILISNSFMPKLDEMIASLEAVMLYPNFTFDFTNDNGKVIQLDQGDIGPVLAGLKVTKAYFTMIVGYQWELAVNGKYDWADNLNGMKPGDFDHLTAKQTESLDYIENLFTVNSSFSKMKPEWKAKVQAIPNLLLSAVNDAQKGLQYSIDESKKPTGQEHDLYVVGTGVDADVDPADLQKAIDVLESTKKYLTGDVNFTYNNGIRTLKVNFAKIFQIDGIQSQFPYFAFYPYNEWNDIVKADTTWSTYQYGIQPEVFQKLGYSNLDMLYFSPSFTNSNDTLAIVASEFDTAAIPGVQNAPLVLATLTAIPSKPCSYTYTKNYDRVLVNPGANPDTSSSPYYYPPYKSVPHKSSGIITINGCRQTNGMTEFVEYVDSTIKGPLYFTDASGKKTLDITDLSKYNDDIPALETKIIFRDPTFSGVLPEMTQAKIWGAIKSLGTIRSGVTRECKEKLDTIPNPYYDSTLVTNPNYYQNPTLVSYRNKCTTIMPQNPTDLDQIVSALYWMGYLF